MPLPKWWNAEVIERFLISATYRYIISISIILLLLGIITLFLNRDYPQYGFLLAPIAGALLSTGAISLIFRLLLQYTSILNVKREFKDYFTELERVISIFDDIGDIKQEARICLENLHASVTLFNDTDDIRHEIKDNLARVERAIGDIGKIKAFAEDIDYYSPSREIDNDQEQPAIYEQLKKDIENTKFLGLYGVTLKDFFHEGGYFSKSIEPFFQDGNQRTLLSIIANPFNKQMIKRSLWEEGSEFERGCNNGNDRSKYFESSSFTDIYGTIQRFGLLKKHLSDQNKAKLKIFNDGEPGMWLVLTDDHTYFQPYAYGRGKSLQDKGFCIGQWFFVIGFKRTSQFSTAFHHHYQHLWECADNIEFDEMVNILNESNRKQELAKAWPDKHDFPCAV